MGEPRSAPSLLTDATGDADVHAFLIAPEQASPRGGEQEEPDNDLTPPVRRIGGVGDLRESVDTFTYEHTAHSTDSGRCQQIAPVLIQKSLSPSSGPASRAAAPQKTTVVVDDGNPCISAPRP